MLNKTVGHMERLISELQNGRHTPGKLAESLNMSKRQVYRLLEIGLGTGEILRVAAGIYVHKSTNRNDFQSYMSVNVSQSLQHNNTLHNENSCLGLDCFSKHREASTRLLRDSEEDGKIRVIVRFVCDKAELIASELEIKRAEKIVRQAIVRQAEIDFLLSNEMILEEYTMESVRRMVERLEIDPETIRVNMVAYFFGIFRNVVRSDARAWYRQWKALLKDGAELEVAVGFDEKSDVAPLPPSAYEEPVILHDTCNDEEDSVSAHKDTKNYDVPEEWTFIAVAFEELIEKYSLRRAAAHRPSVRRVVAGLVDEGIRPADLQCALDDVVKHDPRATEYLVRLVKSGLVDETVVQLERHYARSKTRVSAKAKSNDQTKPEPIKDDRYDNFYRLFPDG